MFTALTGISGKVYITSFQKSQSPQPTDNMPCVPGKESKGKLKIMKCRKTPRLCSILLKSLTFHTLVSNHPISQDFPECYLFPNWCSLLSTPNYTVSFCF